MNISGYYLRYTNVLDLDLDLEYKRVIVIVYWSEYPDEVIQ